MKSHPLQEKTLYSFFFVKILAVLQNYPQYFALIILVWINSLISYKCSYGNSGVSSGISPYATKKAYPVVVNPINTNYPQENETNKNDNKYDNGDNVGNGSDPTKNTTLSSHNSSIAELIRLLREIIRLLENLIPQLDYYDINTVRGLIL